MTKENLIKIIKALRDAAADKEALKAKELYPDWNDSKEYKIGDRVLHNGILYKCLQTHTAQNAWTPLDSPSLWTGVLIPDETVIPEWKQPESTNPYKKGDKVTHNGKTWESTVDDNVWEPGVYGWGEV